MSTYNAPTAILSIFNPTNWQSSDSISQDSGDLRYLRLTGGTETGLVYLSKGFVASSASQINADLNVDSGTLKVDASNNRVGVMSSSPATTLDVVGSCNITSSLGVGSVLSVSGNKVGIMSSSPTRTLDVVGSCFISTSLGIGSVLSASGNKVGILSSSPTYTLEVAGDICSTTGSYFLGASNVLSSTRLGTSVVNSSLTNVGTLTALTVNGTTTLGVTTTANCNVLKGETQAYYSSYTDPLSGQAKALKVSGGAAFDSIRTPSITATTDNLTLEANGSNTLYSTSIYNMTTAVAASVCITASSGYLMRSTSSAAVKTDVENIDSSYSAKIFDMRPVWYRSLCPMDRKDWSHWGLIAEELEKIDPRLCTYGPDGKPDGVQYCKLIPLILHQLQIMRKELDAMRT